MRLFFICLFCFSASLASGQTGVDKLMDLYEQGAFQEVIELGDQFAHTLDRDGWYILGMSYSRDLQDVEAIRCFNRALKLDPSFSVAHYYLGHTHFYRRNLEEAIFHLRKACSLQPSNVDYASFLAEVFTFQGMIDSAIVYGAKAIENFSCPASAYILLGQLYYQKGAVQAALETYEQALKVLEPMDESFLDALYTIAQIHYLEGDLEQAERRLIEFRGYRMEDYQALSKLIQVYYAQGSYDQGQALKPILYRAYQQGKLPPDMRSDGFCFDQFMLEEKKILAFEQFPESEAVYTKHIFYVTDTNGEVESTLHTECNQRVRAIGKKYVLVKSTNSQENYYYQYLFEGNSDYGDLKKAILRILKGKEKPSEHP